MKLSKILNIIKNLLAYYFKLKFAGKTPSILTIQLTYSCNYSCIMCQKSSIDKNSYSQAYKHMNFGKLEKLLRDNSKNIAILRITGGEPLMYPQFEKLIDLLNEIKLKYSILTNGSLLNEGLAKKLLKNCLEISISVDSVDRKIYSFIRAGGELDEIKKNIKILNRVKVNRKTPYLNIASTCFTFNIKGLPDLVRFCHQNKIPTISVSEGAFYNTPLIKEEHFIKNEIDKCYKAVNEAQKTADKYGVIIRWNSQILYFSKEDNQVISNRNPIIGCINFFFSGLITPDFEFKICPLSNPICDLKVEDLQMSWNGIQILKDRELLNKNEFPLTCRYCPDYNKHLKESNNDYSYVDFQKKTKYWKQ